MNSTYNNNILRFNITFLCLLQYFSNQLFYNDIKVNKNYFPQDFKVSKLA